MTLSQDTLHDFRSLCQALSALTDQENESLIFEAEEKDIRPTSRMKGELLRNFESAIHQMLHTLRHAPTGKETTSKYSDLLDHIYEIEERLSANAQIKLQIIREILNERQQTCH